MKIGLIAGSGQFPLIFLKAARSKGYIVPVIGLIGEAGSELERDAAAMEWINLGQIEKMMSFFKKNDVKDAVLLGAVNKTRMFSDFKPDMTAISMISRMKDTHDDAILRAFAEVMEGEGIVIRPSTFLLPELLAPKGCWTKRSPSESEMADILLGYSISKKIGSLDIGQSVVIGGGSVLAVEAIEGTDAAIKRGGSLAKGNAVVVKTAKPQQDMRFDVPAVGIDTLKAMKSAGLTALGVETGKAVVFDFAEMVAYADENGLAVIGLEQPGLD